MVFVIQYRTSLHVKFGDKEHAPRLAYLQFYVIYGLFGFPLGIAQDSYRFTSQKCPGTDYVFPLLHRQINRHPGSLGQDG